MHTFFTTTPRRRKNKYNAVRTLVDGIWFDSKGEADRYVQLKMLLRAGEISELRCHPRYKLEVNGVKIAVYESDFEYIITSTGELKTEDWKPGVVTREALIKINLFEVLYGRPVFLSGRKNG